MRKTTLFLLLMLPVLASVAQQPLLLPNGDFEQWTSGSYEDPTPWFTQNEYTAVDYGLPTTTKITGFSNSFAVRLETKASGTDTFAGIIANTQDNIAMGEGGQPFSLQATNFLGTARYDIKTGDTAFILLMFKKSSNVISMDTFYFYGSQTTATPFSLPLNTLPQAPDSVIIIAASGNVINGRTIAGSWIELDGLGFDDGVLYAPAPDGDFENWATTFYDEPDNWTNNDEGDVIQSTDKYTGTYAAKLVSKDDGSGFVDAGSISLGNFSGPSTIGIPFTRKTDTLFGYYKYSTPGTDEAVITILGFDATGMPVGTYVYHQLPTASTYTYFEVPISFPSAPARLYVDIASSDYNANPVDGSTLYVDDIHLKNSPVGINNVKRSLTFTVYPNPANEQLFIKLHENNNEATDVTIVDIAGKTVYQNTYAATSQLSVPVADLVPGVYQYRIVSGNKTATGKFVKE